MKIEYELPKTKEKIQEAVAMYHINYIDYKYEKNVEPLIDKIKKFTIINRIIISEFSILEDKKTLRLFFDDPLSYLNVRTINMINKPLRIGLKFDDCGMDFDMSRDYFEKCKKCGKKEASIKDISDERWSIK